ncbi:lysophospholipid acyltransferase family protein [Peptoniphilus olsenii]|uniref:lysophospholipid acyltransferase family protein n=1 Tax=Peptoniphilus olsenii TaxID=411570 RepID=UPI003395A652
MLYRFLKFLFAIIFKIFYRIELYNKDNIPNHNKNLIICGNHSSNLDPIILTVYFDRPIYWMGKKELFENKILGKILQQLGVFPVDRNHNDLRAIKTSLKILKDNKVLGIFPEGTRVKEINYDEIKAGIALIAQKTNSEILPVYIDSDFKLFKKIKIYYRKPIKIDKEKKYNNTELMQISQDIMRTIYGEEIKWKLY